MRKSGTSRTRCSARRSSADTTISSKSSVGGLRSGILAGVNVDLEDGGIDRRPYHASIQRDGGALASGARRREPGSLLHALCDQHFALAPRLTQRGHRCGDAGWPLEVIDHSNFESLTRNERAGGQYCIAPPGCPGQLVL